MVKNLIPCPRLRQGKNDLLPLLLNLIMRFLTSNIGKENTWYKDWEAGNKTVFLTNDIFKKKL